MRCRGARAHRQQWESGVWFECARYRGCEHWHRDEHRRRLQLANSTTPIPASCISGGVGGGGWGVASNVVSLSTPTDEVVIGGSTVLNSGKLSVDATDIDQILLTLQAHSAQTLPLLVLENSVGTDVFSVDVNGQVTMAAHPTDGGSSF